MLQLTFISLVLIFFLKYSNSEGLIRDWTVGCRLNDCKEGLETCISSGCFGRSCLSMINEDYPSCSKCASEILDTNSYEMVNGNYHLICDSTDDLQVKACLFYCRVYYYPYGECMRQNNNVPICKCGTEIYITTTTSIATISSTTTQTTTTTTTITSSSTTTT